MSPRATLGVAAAGMLLLLCGCERPASALMPMADQSQAIDRVWTLMLWVCSTLYFAVLAALAWAVWRRPRDVSPRKGLGDGPREGTSRDGTVSRMLFAWVLLIVGILTWFVTVSFLQDRRLHGGRADLEIRITAKQWWWEVEYVGDQPWQQFTTANELHLPRDRTARIELNSADVIHSFWVPALGGKEDLIPGHTNVVWVTPRHNGRYHGECAEFCGLQHAHMAFAVRVSDAAVFQRWQDAQRRPARVPLSSGTAALGARVFQRSACATCHTIRGTQAGGRFGPDLTHVASRETLAAGRLPMRRQELLAWIADPQHFKPGNHMPAVRLQPQEMAALADYLMTLQ